MTMVDEQRWLTRLRRQAAGRDAERNGAITAMHGRIGGMAWQMISAGASASGRKLLIVELPDGAEERVLAALRVAVGLSPIQ